MNNKVIEAIFLSATATTVKLRLANGQVFDYPLEKLSPASQTQAKTLTQP
jgi:hypothetical protein